MGQSLADLPRLPGLNYWLKGHEPPPQADPPRPADGHPAAWQAEVPAAPWWAANVENFRSSFFDPHWGQAIRAELDCTSFWNSLLHWLHTYS